ncbi:MAG: hypothetical protein JWN72_397, partial [Thermoleophilia bacterium]|nr:hypothetical protein [Thermoleophilia bacterium]
AMRRLGVRCLVDGASEQARGSNDADAERRDAAEARRWLMRAAGRGDERSAELLASFDNLFD